MWSRNALTERLNLELPILQAPMGEITTPALAADVSNAGGLGGLGMWGFSAQEAERRIAGFRQQSGGSLNVNYPIWEDPGDLTNVGLPMRERVQALYDAKGLAPAQSKTETEGKEEELKRTERPAQPVHAHDALMPRAAVKHR